MDKPILARVPRRILRDRAIRLVELLNGGPTWPSRRGSMNCTGLPQGEFAIGGAENPKEMEEVIVGQEVYIQLNVQMVAVGEVVDDAGSEKVDFVAATQGVVLITAVIF